MLKQQETVEDEYISPNVSYEKLKEKSNNYPAWYRVWVDIIYTLKFSDFWYGIVAYPLLTLYILFYTRYWFLPVLYCLWFYYDLDSPNNGGRKTKMWKATSKCTRDYYPIGLVKTADLANNRNYIFANFPHGIFAVGCTTNFNNDVRKFEKLFPGLDSYTATLGNNFFSPISRDKLLSFGLISASERSITNVLTVKPNSGRVCNIVVGGVAESFHSDPDEYRLVLKRRKGFVRVALKTGSALVPVFSFGENQLFHVVRKDWLRKIQDIIYRLSGFAPVTFWGRKFGPIPLPFPRSSPIITVVGQPINLPKIENPSKDEIDHYHKIFQEELYDLFERHKEKYDPRGNDARITFI